MEKESWESLLKTIDSSIASEKGINVLEKIKTDLQAFPDVYQDWETANFDINHSFQITRVNELAIAISMPPLYYLRCLSSTSLTRLTEAQSLTICQTACENNLTEILQYLLDSGVDINKANALGSTPLLWAAKNGHLEAVKILMKGKADVNKSNINGRTPLFWACHRGYMDIVKLLVDNGADTNVKDAKNLGLLHTHVIKHLDLVKYLIEDRNVDDKTVDIFGNCPIHYAAMRGSLPVVKYLISDRNLDCNIKNPKTNSTLLHSAACNNDIDVLKYLVDDMKVDHKIRDMFGKTLLHEAVEEGNVDTVKYLIEDKGMDPMVIDTDGDTLLHTAASANKNVIELATYLVERGIPVNVVNQTEQTPVHIATREGNFELLQYLLEQQGADVDAKDNLKTTALHHACLSKRMDIIKYLIEDKKADFTLLDENNWSPIYYAAGKGHLDLVKYFVEELNVDCVTPGEAWGWTPLYLCALYSCDMDTVKYLISKGADINVPTTEGRTPAQASCVKGSLAVLKHFVEDLGATLDTIDIYQHNALGAAVEKGHLDIAKYLIEEKGLDVNIKDVNDSSMIHLAVRSQNLDLLKYLVQETEAKRYINSRRSDTRCTPLHEAVGKDLLAISDYLISKGAIVNAGDCYTNFPLHIAAARGFLEVVKLLVARRANLNPKNNIGMTPLQRAAKAGHIDVVKFLIECGANVTVVDKRGNSALDQAMREKKYEVVDYLRNLNIN